MGGKDIEICWWCQTEKATTREHRVKRSRLEDEIGLTQLPEPLTLYSNDVNHPHPTKLKSSDSKAVKFGKTMCAYCNGARSQPFDKAYQHFVKWAYDHPGYVRKKSALKWDRIFEGSNVDQRHLARYYLKNICCRLVDTGLEIPPEFIDYLGDYSADKCFSLICFRDFSLADEFKEATGCDYFSPYIQTALAEDENNPVQPVQYYATFVDGYIGTLFGWVEGSKGIAGFPDIGMQRRSRLFDRRGLPLQQLFGKLDTFAEHLKNRNLSQY